MASKCQSGIRPTQDRTGPAQAQWQNRRIATDILYTIYYAMPCHAMPYHTIPCHTIPYQSILYSTILHYPLPSPPIPSYSIPSIYLSIYLRPSASGDASDLRDDNSSSFLHSTPGPSDAGTTAIKTFLSPTSTRLPMPIPPILTMDFMPEGAGFHASIPSPTTSLSPSTSTSTSTERPSPPWPRRRRRPLHTSSLFLVILLTCCVSLSSANAVYIKEQMVEPADDDAADRLAALARSGTILVDRRPPPPHANSKAWILATEHDGLQRRGDVSSSSPGNQQNVSSASASSATSMNSTTNSTASQTATTTSSSASAVSTTQAASPLPSPFDQGFSGNITDSCQSFMDDMLTNATFKSCLPFSLLLQVHSFPPPPPQRIN